MKYILTPDEMRLADSTAINKYKIASALLMENAAHSATNVILNVMSSIKKDNPIIKIFCGSGNNGGDGFAIARHLYGLYTIKVYWIGGPEKMSRETFNNFKSLELLNIPMSHIENEADVMHCSFSADCIIDALIGVGGSEHIHGVAQQILFELDTINALKIAIDAPTGLNTETGNAHQVCFKADHTVTMFAIKTGMMIDKGINYCGEIHLADLGAPSKIVKELSKIWVIEKDDLNKFLIPRKLVSSKFDYGRAIIISGSVKYPGAASLCCNSAIKIGAGLVELYSTYLHSSILPEIIPTIVPSTPDGSISNDSLKILIEAISKASSVVIGPGLGSNPETIKLVEELIKSIPENIPVVIDADGLRAINKKSKLRKNIILTPHTGEFSRLIGIERSIIEQNKFLLCKKWAKKLDCIILLKSVPTVISDGENSYWNINGNPGMATAGSGDVLSGIIGGLLAQGFNPFDAVAYGAFIHAEAGDIYANNFSQLSLTASSIQNCIEQALI